MKKKLLFIISAILFTACSVSSTRGYSNATPESFFEKTAQSNTFLLDVRTNAEYKEAHIKGATLIPVQALNKRLGELEKQKNKTILVYCRSGRRSVKAAQILHKAGFTDVVNLTKGINGWKKAGLPTE